MPRSAFLRAQARRDRRATPGRCFPVSPVSTFRSSFKGSQMEPSRRLHLGAFMRPASIHTGAWRYPGAYPDANFNIVHLRHFAQTLERARFDAFFMADHMAVLN